MYVIVVEESGFPEACSSGTSTPLGLGCLVGFGWGNTPFAPHSLPVEGALSEVMSGINPFALARIANPIPGRGDNRGVGVLCLVCPMRSNVVPLMHLLSLPFPWMGW